MSLKQGKNSTVSPGPQQIQVQAQSGGPNSRTLRGGPPPRPEDYHQPRAIPAYTHPGSAAQQQGIPLQQGRHPHTAPSPHDMNKGGVSSQGPPPVVGTPPTGPSPGPQMSQQTQMYASVSMSQGHRSSQHQGPRQGHQPQYYRSSGPTANGRVPYQTGPRYSAPQTVTSAPPPQMFQHPNQMIPGHVPQQAYPQPTLFIPQQYPPVLQYRPQAIPHFQPPQPTIQSATAYFQPAPQGPGPGGTQTTYRTGEQLQYFQSYGYAPQAQPMQTTQQQRPPSMPTGQITMIQQPPQPPQQVTPPLQQQTQQQQQQQLPQKRERKIIKITDNTGRDVTEEILSGGSGSSNPTPPNSGRSSATATPPQTQQQAGPPAKPGESSTSSTSTSIAAQFAAQVAATLDTSPAPSKDTTTPAASSVVSSVAKETVSKETAARKSESPKPPGQVAAAAPPTPTVQPEAPAAATAVQTRTEEQAAPSEQAGVGAATTVSVDTPAYVPVAEPSSVVPAKSENQPLTTTVVTNDDTDSAVSRRAEPAVAGETKPVAMGTKPVTTVTKPTDVAPPPQMSKDSNPPPPVPAPKSAQSMVVDSKDNRDATKDRNDTVAEHKTTVETTKTTSSAKPKLPEEAPKPPTAGVSTKAPPESKSEEKPAAEVAGKKPAGETTIAPEKAAAPSAVEEVNDESPQAKQVAKKSQKKKMKELNKKGDSKDTDLMDAFREKEESQTVEEPKPVEEPKTEPPPPPTLTQAKPEETKSVEVKVEPPKEDKPEVKEAPKVEVVPPKAEPPKVDTAAPTKDDSPAPKVDGVANSNETEENDEEVVEIEDKSGLKYKYREDQWSPLNPEGKKQYDRSFLLQFQPECIDKPDGLPKIVDVVLDKPLIITPQQMQGRPQDFRGMGGFNKGGPPGIPDLMPSYMKSPGGGHGRMVHGPNMGRQQSRGGNRREPRKIIPSVHTRLDDVELNKADNAWKPSTMKKGADKSPEEKETDEIFKKVQGILNKLTPQKFQTLCQQVLDLDISSEERLKGVIDLVFEKAITEPNFSVAYANMCRCLIHLKVPMKDNPKQTVNFRKLLLNRCQREFEKDKDDELKKDERMKKIAQAKNEDEKKMMEVELEQEMTKARRRSLGNIRFIGELFKLKMLTENIMHDCVVKLLKSNDEESLECLCRLLTTIGKDLDFEKAKFDARQKDYPRRQPRMDQYFQQMDKIIKQKKTSSRVRFMIQDVLELRMNNWVPRRDDNNPKTIDQIHKEAELEIQQQNLKLAQVKQDSRRQDRRGGGGGGRNPQAASTQDGDGWNTVPVGKSARVSIDPNRLKFSKQQFDDGNIQLGPGGRPGAFGGWMKGSSGGTGAKSAQQQQQQQQQQEDSGRSTPSNRYSALSGDMSYDAARRNTSRGGSGSRDNSKTGRGQQQAPAIGRRNSRDQARDEQRFARDSVVDSLKRIESVGSRRSQSGERPERPERVREEPEKERRQQEKSRPSPTPSPAPAPAPTRELDRAGMEKKSQAILDEYLGIRDLKEAIRCVKELSPVSLLHVLVEHFLNQTLERSPQAREATGHLLHDLVKQEIVPVEQYLKGLGGILEFADDMAIDIPHIWSYLGELIGPMVQDGSVPLTFLKEACSPLLACDKAGLLVSEILHQAAKNIGPKRVGELWKSSGLDWKNFLSKNEDVHDFVQKKKLGFTLDESRALPRKPEPLPMDRIQGELERLLTKDKADNEKIFDWIEASVDEATTKERTFIRALMTAVCRSAIIGEGTGQRCDTQGIQKRVVLLQKYLDNESTRELQALFALQALMVQLDQPPNLLRMFFDTLYDEDVISEDAFYAWESNTDPAEQEGKGVALKSVTAFFTWLREAEEEETDS